jgi:hypothetical protein
MQLLTDLSVIILPNALQIRKDNRHFEAIRDGYPLWSSLHSQGVERVVDDETLIFWSETRQGREFWGSYLGLMIDYAKAYEDGKAEAETLVVGDGVTFTLSGREIGVTLTLPNVVVNLPAVPPEDLRKLGAFFTRYAEMVG